MWNPEHSMAIILAAAEAGTQEAPPESALRARLDTLIQETMARRNTLANNGEYRLLCRALERAATEAR